MLDDDAVIRLVPDSEDSFWQQTVRVLLRVRPGLVPEPQLAQGAMIRHLGPPRTFPYVSYHQVLTGDPAIPAEFFKDQVVLIGKDVRASLIANAAHGDTVATPFLKVSRALTPRVEIQATLIENVLMGRTIQPASTAYNLAVLSIAALAGWLALMFWRPLRSSLLVVIAALIAVGVSLVSFVTVGTWQFTVAPVTALLLALGFMTAGTFWMERQRVHELRRSFKKYVSADLVDQIVANEGRVKLGGERREITVLFCDLTDFTVMCERLAPEVVSDVINLYTSEMSRVVMSHGGTVDKFIGDSVMAFWGAPLDDAEHALHATLAAVEMQAAMELLQPRFIELGAERMTLRVGVHSGQAIVGNMGSQLRFEYTALGDTVNIASRLEDANKLFGTHILLSGSTAGQLKNAVSLRRVDRVRVKGKQQAIDIYTPSHNEYLVETTEKAWAAYVRQNWATARALWSDIAALDDHDPLARVFEARIAALEAAPPVKAWDGATDLA